MDLKKIIGQMYPKEPGMDCEIDPLEAEQKLLKWAYETALGAVGEDELTHNIEGKDVMVAPRRKSGMWYWNKLRAEIRQALRIKFNQGEE